jgi:glycosyltransferase involved in cell wall biosynthesis
MLHLYPNAHCGGAEMMTATMFRALVDRGHDVDVILSQKHPQITGPYTLDGVNVHPYRDKGDPFEFIPGADLIVTHLENTPRASILGQIHRIPVVQVLHNTFEPTKRWVRPDVTVVYNSEWMKADFEEWYRRNRVDPPRSIVVRPPVDGTRYVTTPGDCVTLVNLYKPKGSATFWALAERMPDVKFLGVIGAYGDQDVRSLPNVEIVEHGPDIRDRVYARTRVLLMPSDYESWGRVGCEAAHSGIPTIANPTPGLLESLGTAGTFVDRLDIDGWERELRRLLDGRRWRTASRLAKTRAKELDPAPDLARWASLVEGVGRHGSARRRVSA